ncbi:hypothetical protein K402DRAFT_393604 [Aulographum hederae CBS 113979]|uniref:Uncharacterized protein n=1 Tax=Aulographum hederae CBS 113979 TaxID=1176131 RepID=A0A6G1H012_9PEZI|nr:hypothetical protein K402DRAFT_393604 [Aulographum hederae CBS 113979]
MDMDYLGNVEDSEEWAMLQQLKADLDEAEADFTSVEAQQEEMKTMMEEEIKRMDESNEESGKQPMQLKEINAKLDERDKKKKAESGSDASQQAGHGAASSSTPGGEAKDGGVEDEVGMPSSMAAGTTKTQETQVQK